MVKTAWSWFARRPFFSGLVVSVLLVTPAYIRQEYAIDEAHAAATDAREAADKLAVLVKQFEDDRTDRREELCRRDVADQENDRIMWLAAFELFIDSPEAIELRATLEERLPQLECNTDYLAVPIGE